MENREQQILSEIKVMMASIRSQLERLDVKMAELQQVVDPEGFEAASIDIGIDAEEVVELERQAEVQEIPLAMEEDVEVQEKDDDDLPGVFDLPEPVSVASKPADDAAAVQNERLTADHAWRKDMPGTPVKDIRSAIGLNDRVRFINLLFNEDAQGFVNALMRINSMESLDEVVEYVCAEYPEWDLSSEIVYRFMMAVRRKIR